MLKYIDLETYPPCLVARQVQWYDVYVYSPLQSLLWPLVSRVPRVVEVGGRHYTVFTANIVSWSRTLLVVPIAASLK